MVYRVGQGREAGRQRVQPLSRAVPVRAFFSSAHRAMLPPMARYRLFLSAVSSEFERARDLLAASLRAREMDIAVQSDFRQHDDTTLHKLHDYIRDCQAVVCIIGTRSGAMPTAAEAAPYARDMLPGGITEASYTQWELFFARYYRRRLLRFLLKNDKWEADRAAPDYERPDLQAAFVRWLERDQGQDRGEFDTVDRLCHLVLREDWPKARPEPVVHLPRLSLGTGFRGRSEFLRSLHTRLQAGHAARVAITSLAVRGLGGVGKTCAAMEYAWQYRHAYRAVLWCSAETPEALDRGLAALAGPLQLPQATAREQPEQCAAVLRWLNEHPDWLLILDNVDTPEALHAVQALGIGGGCLLLTGRLARFGRGIEALDLDLLHPDTATAMLLQATPGRRALPDDEAQAAALAVQELDRLPLALEHAVAFIEYLGCSFRLPSAAARQAGRLARPRGPGADALRPHGVPHLARLGGATHPGSEGAAGAAGLPRPRPGAGRAAGRSGARHRSRGCARGAGRVGDVFAGQAGGGAAGIHCAPSGAAGDPRRAG